MRRKCADGAPTARRRRSLIRLRPANQSARLAISKVIGWVKVWCQMSDLKATPIINSWNNDNNARTWNRKLFAYKTINLKMIRILYQIKCRIWLMTPNRLIHTKSFVLTTLPSFHSQNVYTTYFLTCLSFPHPSDFATIMFFQIHFEFETIFLFFQPFNIVTIEACSHLYGWMISTVYTYNLFSIDT